MNIRKRIISMALTLVVLFSMMAMSVHAAIRYATADLYYYYEAVTTSILTGDYAEATCWNWAASDGYTFMIVYGKQGTDWIGLHAHQVAPGQEYYETNIDGNEVSKFYLYLGAGTDTTRAQGLLGVYTD